MPTMNAEQRAETAKEQFDAFYANCPSRLLLDRIADKWVTLTLSALGEAGGPMRYSELSRKLAGVSQKMLTQTLRNLERDGLIEREVTPSVPVRVDYRITALGASLLEPLHELKAWAEANMTLVEQSREHYDAKSETA